MYFVLHSTLDCTYICHVLLAQTIKQKPQQRITFQTYTAMKNSIKTFVCALALVATAFTVNAEDKEAKKPTGFGTGIYTTKEGKINVMVDKLDPKAAVTLVMKNQNGTIVYRETISKTYQKFGRTLNVDELSAGKYEIEVTSKGEKQSKSFELSEPKTERVLSLK
jgi:flagellar hook assembly protein FlgD